MIGEIGSEGVLRHSELLSYDGTGIMMLANEYLEDGPDAVAKAEISRLLSFMIFSNEQLEAMAGITAASTVQQPQEMAETTATPTGQQLEIATAGSVVDCRNFFEYAEGNIPQGVGDCLQVRGTEDLEYGTHRVFGPAPSFPDAGWKEYHYDWALETLQDAILKLLEVFSPVARPAPSINVVFTVYKTPKADMAVLASGSPCGIFVYTNSLRMPEDQFKQNLAMGVAMCFESVMFKEQVFPKGFYAYRWWYSGLALHLSNVVYPFYNYEWGDPPATLSNLNKLAQIELKTTMFDRAYLNSIFFQYLENERGYKAFINLIKYLPTSGGFHEQEIQLSQYPGIESFFHDFTKALTDKKVKDTSGAVIPYPINEWNCPTIKIDKPFWRPFTFFPFWVERSCLVIDEGKVAELSFFERHGSVSKSMRPTHESDISWMEVPSMFGLPDKDCNREVTMVVTSTILTDTGTQFDLSTYKVVDAPCTIEGVWVVDNWSLWLKPWDFTLVDIDGEIRATFHKKNNNVDVVYDNWEYIVHRMGTGVLGDVELYFYEKITRTINAQGTTTYKLDGKEINFGHFFESDFMTGTETIHHIKEWAPKGYIPDTNETIVQTPDWTYRDIFTSFRDYELSGGILRLSPYVWSSKECILNKVGDVEE
jgi:hypothetical protein